MSIETVASSDRTLGLAGGTWYSVTAQLDHETHDADDVHGSTRCALLPLVW